jgi:ClpP class serine protease
MIALVQGFSRFRLSKRKMQQTFLSSGFTYDENQPLQKIYNHFVEYVKSRRNAKLTQSDEFLFNGEFWAGQSAVDFGLVDGIDNLYNFIRNKFGNEVKVKHIKVKESFIKKYISAKTDIIGEIKQQLIYDKFNL